jgi:ankyrin repeat protein
LSIKTSLERQLLLLVAAEKNQAEIVRLLLDWGANIEHNDNSGRTALFRESRNESLDVAQLLIDCGANIEHQDNYGRTTMSLAKEYNNFGLLFCCRHNFRETKVLKLRL